MSLTSRTKNRKVEFFNLNYGDEEFNAVKEVLLSKWITMGSKIEQFEKEFSGFIGTKYGVALNNCTAALHLAMRILNISPGDEVIVPSLTFVATVNSVLYTGGTPVFADIKSDEELTISPDDIRKKITSKTKAIIVMHYAGFGCDMLAIMDIAKKHNLKVVEDACHAPGGIRQDIKLGTIGDISCYSFYANKNMSTAEGGMLLTNNEGYYEKTKLLRSHGMTTSAHQRNAGAEFYNVIDLGYNYRLDEIRAAIGIAQLSKLPTDIHFRNKMAEKYKTQLEGVKDIIVPFNGYKGTSTYYIFPVIIKNTNRSLVKKKLQDVGIQTSIHYPPVHLFDHVKKYSIKLPNTERVGEQVLSLPLYYNLSDEDLDYVCKSLRDVL